MKLKFEAFYSFIFFISIISFALYEEKLKSNHISDNIYINVILLLLASFVVFLLIVAIKMLVEKRLFLALKKYDNQITSSLVHFIVAFTLALFFVIYDILI